MNRTATVLALACVVLSWTLSGLATAGEQNEAIGSHRHGHSRDDSASVTSSPSGEQRLCPVTGQPIDTSQFVDHEGKRIYFCCSACKEPFLRDPAKYIRAMEGAGVTLERAPGS